MKPEDVAQKIITLQQERAEYVREHSNKMAPFGHRSANVKLAEATLITDGLIGKNEGERLADLEIKKAASPVYSQHAKDQRTAMFEVANMDSEIDYWTRIYETTMFYVKEAAFDEGKRL